MDTDTKPSGTGEIPSEPESHTPLDGLNVGRTVIFGALLVIVGIAVAGSAPIPGTNSSEDAHHMQSILGGFLVLVGWAALGFGIHRLGRSGPSDGPTTP